MKNKVIRNIILVTLLGITYSKLWSKFQFYIRAKFTTMMIFPLPSL